MTINEEWLILWKSHRKQVFEEGIQKFFPELPELLELWREREKDGIMDKEIDKSIEIERERERAEFI